MSRIRAREYYPEYGRFMQEDPIGDRGGSLNWYLYVGNNPVNMVDPEGKLGCTYSITGHRLYCITESGEAINCYAKSGNNNPSDQCKKNIGPIPVGLWDINRPGQTGRANLSELPGNNNEKCIPRRTALQIHGWGTTEGCIAIKNNSCRDKILNALNCEGGGLLQVTE